MRSNRLHLLMFIAILLLPGAAQTAAASGSFAVIINADAALGANLPSDTDAAAAALAYRAKGLKVAVTPDRRTIAVTKPQAVEAYVCRDGDPPGPLPAMGIAQNVTPEQVKNGYITIPRADLTPEQWEATLRIVGKSAYFDEQGKPKEPGTQLSVVVRPEWALHVTTPLGDRVICHKLYAMHGPPTPAAIEAEPLAGSALWYAWPYSASTAMNAKISIKAGTYKLEDLAREITKATGLAIDLKTTKPYPLQVTAADTPVLQLLWAIEVATKAKVSIDRTQDSVAITISDTIRMENAEHNVLQSVPGIGYYPAFSPALTPGITNLLKGVREDTDEVSIGWRFADLPPVYQKKIRDAWTDLTGTFMDYNGPFDPAKANAIWVGTVAVTVEISEQDGGGCGMPSDLSAL